jgi:hypothetical protein
VLRQQQEQQQRQQRIEQSNSRYAGLAAKAEQQRVAAAGIVVEMTPESDVMPDGDGTSISFWVFAFGAAAHKNRNRDLYNDSNNRKHDNQREC